MTRQNKVVLPPGLGVPAALQEKLDTITKLKRPYRSVGANQFGPALKTVGKGSLVYFNYLFWIHDPYPLVIITSISSNYVRGINLHYLTFPYIRFLLQGQGNVPNCNNPNFSFNNVGANQYIAQAFRTYKRNGIKQLKTLDCNFILNVMGSVRALDPNEVEKIRAIVREQIRRRVQPSAEEMSNTYTGMIRGASQPNFENPLPHPVVQPPEG